MNSLLIDLQYFASVDWYKKVYNYKNIYFSVYEVHSKMSFRNRTIIAGADGPLRLSVPIEQSRNERQLYMQVNTAKGRWPREHFRAIQSCYNRSPWFEYYRDDLAALFEIKIDLLFDWNLACHEWVVEKIGLQQTFKVVDERDLPEGISLDNAVNLIRPAHQQSGKLAADSSQERPVSGQEIGPYRQVFYEKTGFIAGLSILDLLFCEGPKNTLDWLKGT